MIIRIVLLILFFANIVKSQDFSQKLYPNDPRQGAYFGRFVVQNDDFIVVSAYKDSEKASSSGALYIFKKVNNEYLQSQKVFPDDGTVEQFFGYSMGISKDWIVTGAHHDSSKGASSGAAYILKKNNYGKWDIVQKLVPDDLSEGDEFGKKVSLYGDVLVSCGYLDDNNGINSGVVYIYKLIDGVWQEDTKISPSTPMEYSQFGLSLDLFKDKLIVGAPFEAKKELGAAYIFEYKNNMWNEVSKLRPDDLKDYDQFGITAKINDDFAFVASIKNDDFGENSGIVYVYKRVNGDWQYLQKLNAPDEEEGDGFGIDIALSDSLAAIGAYFDDDNGLNSGSVYLFKLIDNRWQFSKKINPSDGGESDAFGVSISIVNNNLLAGAFSDSDKGFLSGSAYLFPLDRILNISTVENDMSAKVYPDLVCDYINIESAMPNPQVLIFNINGKVVFKDTISKSKTKIYLQDYPGGLYFVRISSGKISETFKLIKI